MVDYFNGSESAREKLVSAKWDVENVGGELFGVIRTKLTEAFTPDEEQEWIDELIGQAADGFGEGFEQREIKTERCMCPFGMTVRITLWKTNLMFVYVFPISSRWEECKIWMYQINIRCWSDIP